LPPSGWCGACARKRSRSRRRASSDPLAARRDSPLIIPEADASAEAFRDPHPTMQPVAGSRIVAFATLARRH
jgi:hypothetical protein